jgi:hypothetical protein
MGLLYGRAGRLTAQNGGLRRGQRRQLLGHAADADPARANPADYFTLVPNLLLLFVLTLTYAIIQPLMVPASVLAFGSAWFVWRYLGMYVHYPVHESGGALWPAMFDYSTAGLVISQLTVIGLFSLKRGWPQLCLLGLLPPATLLFYRRYGGRLHRLASVLPLKHAIEHGQPATDAFDELALHTVAQSALSERGGGEPRPVGGGDAGEARRRPKWDDPDGWHRYRQPAFLALPLEAVVTTAAVRTPAAAP